MSHLSGQNEGSSDSAAITDTSDAGGPTVKDSFDALVVDIARGSILLRPAADAPVTILGTTGGIELTVTGAGTVAIATDASCYRGQQVWLRAKSVAGGGAYTLEVDPGGVDLTINATGEAPRIMRSETDTWVVMGLEGATIV
jgi:uncharacterized membrane protein